MDIKYDRTKEQHEAIIFFLDAFKVNPDDFEEVYETMKRHFPLAVEAWDNEHKIYLETTIAGKTVRHRPGQYMLGYFYELKKTKEAGEELSQKEQEILEEYEKELCFYLQSLDNNKQARLLGNI